MDEENKMDEGERIVKEAMEAEEKSRRALRHFLEQQREKDGHLFALTLSMGKSRSYLISASLNWVADNVKFAADIPLFQADETNDKKADQDSKEIFVTEDTIEVLQQRRPDWRRQLPMAIYLATRPNRKFPPLLIVGYQGWVYQEDSENWGEGGLALADSVTAVPLDNKNSYCDLDSKDTLYYALDGQHRLMAIKGLKELLDKGQLALLNKDGVAGKKVITRDEVIDMVCSSTGEKRGAVHERLQRVMMEEKIGVEIIPAVMSKESYKDALFRLRTLFVDVNENAKKPTKGESILLDERNGFRIVARRIMVKHKLFKDNKVDHKNAQLSEKSGCYTTLDTLVEIAQTYLGAKRDFAQWGNKMFGEKQFDFIRPEETEIDEAINALGEYFDMFSSLPSHMNMMGGKEVVAIRGEKGENMEDNILFRPIAQAAFAEAVATLQREREKSLKSIFAQVAKQEKAGQLKLHNPKAPWFGILCEPIEKGKMRRHSSYKDMCCRLLVYLLGGGEPDDNAREALRVDFANMRAITEEQAYSLSGELVAKEKVRLPELW